MLHDDAMLDRVIDPQRGGLSPELARHILSLDFPPADHARYAALSAKARQGALSDAENAELEDYLNLNDFLTIIKAKAATSLHHQNPAA